MGDEEVTNNEFCKNILADNSHSLNNGNINEFGDVCETLLKRVISSIMTRTPLPNYSLENLVSFINYSHSTMRRGVFVFTKVPCDLFLHVARNLSHQLDSHTVEKVNELCLSTYSSAIDFAKFSSWDILEKHILKICNILGFSVAFDVILENSRAICKNDCEQVVKENIDLRVNHLIKLSLSRGIKPSEILGTSGNNLLPYISRETWGELINHSMTSCKEAYCLSLHIDEPNLRLQELICSDYYYLEKFARNVWWADIEYCQSIACKSSMNSLLFAKHVPGANYKYCYDRMGDEEKSDFTKFILKNAYNIAVS